MWNKVQTLKCYESWVEAQMSVLSTQNIIRIKGYVQIFLFIYFNFYGPLKCLLSWKNTGHICDWNTDYITDEKCLFQIQINMGQFYHQQVHLWYPTWGIQTISCERWLFWFLELKQRRKQRLRRDIYRKIWSRKDNNNVLRC